MANAADKIERECNTRPRRITISSLNCEEVSERMKRWKEEDEYYKEELAEMEERHQQKVYQLMDDQDAAQIDMDDAEEAFSKAVRGAWHDDNKELKAADVERRKACDELHKLVWEMEDEYHVHGRAVKDFKEKYDRQIRERKPAGEQQTQVRSEGELLKPEDLDEGENMEDDAPQEFLDEHQSELRDGEHGDCPATAIPTNGVCHMNLSPQPHHDFDLPIRPHPNRFSFMNRFVGTYSALEPTSTQGPSSLPAIAANAESYSSTPLEPPASSATSPAIPALRSSVPGDDDDDDLSTHPALPLRLRPIETTPLRPPAAPPSSPTIPTDDLAQRRESDGLSQLDCVMRDVSSMRVPVCLLARPESVESWVEEKDDEEEEEEEEEADDHPAIVSPRRRGAATPFRCGAASPDSAASSSSSSSHTVSPDLRSSPLATVGGLDGAMDDEMAEERGGCSDVQGGRAEKRGAEGAGCSKGKGPAGTPKRAESYSQKQQPVSGEAPGSDRKPAEKNHGDRSAKQT